MMMTTTMTMMVLRLSEVFRARMVCCPLDRSHSTLENGLAHHTRVVTRLKEQIKELNIA